MSSPPLHLKLRGKSGLLVTCFLAALALLLLVYHALNLHSAHDSSRTLLDIFKLEDFSLKPPRIAAAEPPPAESPPAKSPPDETRPAESAPAESPPAKSRAAEFLPAVSLVVLKRTFAALSSFQRKSRLPLANVATFNFGPSVTNTYAHYKLFSLPVPHVPESLTWRDAYPVWVNESRSSCPKIPEPNDPDWLTIIDAIVAHVPCEEPRDSWARDVRWLQHLLAIAGFVIRAHRPWLPVVLLSPCRPPPNLFHCSRLVRREGDVWLYNLTANGMLTRVQPLGSCAMAQPINPAAPAPHRVAYATVLHSSERYVCGAIVLGHSIRRTGSTAEMVVLVSKEITEESRRGLREAGWRVKEIERIRNPNALNGTYNEWNYSKLRLWQQAEYARLVFVDSDLLLLTSVDFLFAFPEISARGNDGSDFNSGVMVLEPSDCTFQLLMENLRRVRSANGGDQGYLNNVFTWWHRLPESINTLKPTWTTDPVKRQAILALKNRWFSEDPSEIHAIHYLGLKPWVCYRDFDCNVLHPTLHNFANEAAHKRWWSVHDSMPESLQLFCMLTSHAKKEIKRRMKRSKEFNASRQLWDG
ncbi:hypothetical protein CLOM_g12700 [Closterium sp. NIES-68]|nr:hypothetical protein CLOM_g12700 [Closterium sp. NIES-68]